MQPELIQILDLMIDPLVWELSLCYDGLMITLRYVFITIVSAFLGYAVLDGTFEVRLGLTDMLNLAADRPFVYRFLLPQLARWTASIIDADARIMARIGAALCYIGAYWSFEQLATTLKWRVGLKAVPIVWSVGLLFLVATRHYIYDAMTLFSFTLAILMLARRQWSGYWLAFILATVSRETTFLLIALFALDQWGKCDYWGRMALQCMAFIAIRGVIMWVFRDYPGVVAYNNFDSYYVVMHNAPIIFILIYGLTTCLAWRIGRQLKHQPPFVRHGTLAMILPMAALMILLGYPYEFRAMVETYPFLLLGSLGFFEK